MFTYTHLSFLTRISNNEKKINSSKKKKIESHTGNRTGIGLIFLSYTSQFTSPEAEDGMRAILTVGKIIIILS